MLLNDHVIMPQDIPCLNILQPKDQHLFSSKAPNHDFVSAQDSQGHSQEDRVPSLHGWFPKSKTGGETPLKGQVQSLLVTDQLGAFAHTHLFPTGGPWGGFRI